MTGWTPILVAGKTGQLARSFTKLADERGIPVVTVGRPQLDLENFDTLEHITTAVAPKAIVNAAAFTAVDAAESEPERAFRVNRDGAARLATVAAKFGIPFIHISTDYVFDGSKPSPYLEEDIASPLNIYGLSKLEGELAVRDAYANALILRTSWVFSPFGQNFVKTMLRLAKTRETVSVVDDQCGSPTSARDLAEAILAILGAPRNCTDGGLYNYACSGETTWYGFAQAIYAGWAMRGHRVPNLNAITTAEYPTPARRPANSRLDCRKIESAFRFQRRPWQKSLEWCLDDLELTSLETPQC